MISKILSHKHFFKLLKQCLSGFKNRIILLLVYMLIVTSINIYLPYFFGEITELFVKKELNTNLIFLLFALYTVKLIIQYFVSYNTNHLSGVISLNLKKLLINKYIESNAIHTDFIKSGDFHQRIFNETGLLQGKLIFGTIHFCKDFFLF